MAEFIIDEEKQEAEDANKLVQNLHGDLGTDNSSKNGGIPSSRRKAPIWTSTKQSMTYLTISGIESELSRLVIEWPKEIMSQLIGNAWDWLQDNYHEGTKETRKIGVRIKIDSVLDGAARRVVIRIAVSNSNVDNLPVFEKYRTNF